MNRAETQIAELYVGLIGRAPDRSGLDFWVQGYTNRLNNGESEDAALAGVAQAMFDADATTAYYPVGLSDREVVAQFYENVLGRTGDRNGVDFWTAALRQPDRQTGEVLVDMIQAVKRYDGNDEAALTSQALFNNKAAVAGHYVEAVSKPDADADIDGATALLDAVGPQTETSTPAAIEEFVTEHYRGLLTDPPLPNANAPTLDLSPVTDLDSSNVWIDTVASFTATDAQDGDLSAYADDVIFTPGSNGLGYYEIAFGEVRLTDAGADAVAAGETLPAVELTAIDSDGNQISRTVQPTYADDYPIDGVETDAVIGDGDTIEGDLERAGDQDWFRIAMRADRQYDVSLSGGFDERIRIIDESGKQVTSEAVSGTEWQAALNFSPNQPGTFYVVADSLEEDAAGYYSLSVSEYGDDPPDLDLSPVTDLDSSNAYYSYTEVATFTATDAQDGDLSAYADEVIFTPGSNSLGYYELYGSDVLLTRTGADAVTAGEALPAVELTAIDSDGNQTSQTVQPTYADDYPIDSVETDAVIGDGDTIEGDLERAGDQDWFRIDMRADREYELELSGNFEERVRVVDERGNEVASKAVGESGWQADLTFSPDASGTYYVVADSRQGEGAGHYSLSAHERVLPAMEETEYVGGDHDTYPYHAVTFIEATFPNGETYTGSGAVVGQNDVLTASHVIYSVNDGGLADSITIYPGRDGSENPYGRYRSELADYYEVDLDGDGMFSEQDSEDDLAVLGLGSALGDQTGWFGLDPNATSGNYNLTGYPGLYQTGYEPRMTNDYGRVTESEDASVFNYDTIESNPGNSGGPLWYQEDNGDTYLVGVASTSGWATDIAGRYGDLTDAIEGNDYLFEGTMTAEGRGVGDQTDGVDDISLVGLYSGAGIDGLESAA